MGFKNKVDTIIINGKIVNVITKEIYDSQIAIKDDYIYSIDEELTNLKDENTKIVDAESNFITPGFIDQHIHLHHTQLNLVEFSKIALLRGTTAIAGDFYGEGVVGGIDAIRNILDIGKKLPIKVFYLLPIPGYIQNGKYGHNGNLNINELNEILGWDECVGTCDTFATEIIDGNKDLIELCRKAQKLGKKISGHGSQLSNDQINDWIRIIKETDDHDCKDENEFLYKLRRGIGVSMRLASGSEDLHNLIKLLKINKNIDTRKVTLNADVISASDLRDKGYLDRAIKIVIKAGIPTIEAYQMATINTAENLKISSYYGSIAPGKCADLLFIDNLEEVNINKVMVDGKFVVTNKELNNKYDYINFPKSFYNTVNINNNFNLEKLKIFNNGITAKVRIIVVDGDSYITQEEINTLSVIDGVIQNSVSDDIMYISAIDRVRGTKKIANGFIKGFNLKNGAIAMTKNSHAQSLLVAGTNHEDMYLAVKTLEKIGGGNIVVAGGKVLKSLPLEYFGLESADTIENVVKLRKELYDAITSLGCSLDSPFETLSFVALPVTIGNLKICEEGIVDVWEDKLVDVVIT